MKKHFAPPASAEEIRKALGLTRQDNLAAKMLLIKFQFEKILKKYKIFRRDKKELSKLLKELLEEIK